MSGRKKTKTIAESLVLLLVVVAPFVSGQENSQPIEPASSRERPLVAVLTFENLDINPVGVA